MKIVHLTDLHFQAAPRLRELGGKRLAATANLYVLGRHRKFSLAAQRAAIAAAIAEDPDVVVFTGDLTAQALESEWDLARTELDPLLRRFPTVMIPGNHDTYAPEPVPGQRMRARFSEWMAPQMPWLHRHDGVAFLALETCRYHLLSSGHTPPSQLARARDLLDEVDDAFVFLCMHYPLRGRDGAPYGPATRALSNARQVESELLERTTKIGAILHGHEHHGFRTTVPGGAGPIPILDPGASGYAWLPKQRRTAHFNVYEASADGIHAIRRLRFDGKCFAEEPGGAYATGR